MTMARVTMAVAGPLGAHKGRLTGGCMAVFVWDRRKRPLMPCSEKRARLLRTRGRAAIRARGYFTIQTAQGLVPGIHHRFCTRIRRADGYGYSQTTIATDKGEAGTGAAYAAAPSLPGQMGHTAHDDAGVSRANG